MTKHEPRVGGTMEISLEVAEMLKRLGDETGCAVILLPEEATALFRQAGEEHGFDPNTVFERIIGAVLAALDVGANGVFVGLHDNAVENLMEGPNGTNPEDRIQ